MTWGLTDSGFSTKPLDVILSDMETAQLAGISPSLDVQPTSPTGVQNGIVAKAVSEVWELAGALYNGMDPDGAVGDQLTNLSLITGTLREAATKTQVVGCTLSLNNTFADAPVGTMIANVAGNSLAQFTNKTLVQYPGGSPPQPVTVDFQAVSPGPVACPDHTLTVITSALTGWISITNPTAGVLGSNIQSDPSLRILRNEELQAAGSTSAAAIRSDVLAQMQPPTVSAPTLSCGVLYNDTDITDINGLYPHSIEVIAYAPGSTSDDDVALCTLILDDKAAGIQTYSGNGTYKQIIDSQGNTIDVFYTRPTDVPIYVDITVVPADVGYAGDTAVADALAAFIATLLPGDDVIAERLKAAAFNAVGVVDITAFTLGTAPSPGGTTNLAMTIRQLATLDSGDVTVTP